MTNIVAAVEVDPAYTDPRLLWDLAVAHQPYPAPASGFNDPPQASKLPWFKAVWASASGPVLPGVDEVLHNPRFAEAAARYYSAEVVRPNKVLANFMAPMPALPPHLDPPTFRGQDRWQPRSREGQSGAAFVGARALAGLMGISGLFERWRVHSATAVSWCYGGDTGEYRYWPEGPGGPPVVVSPPFGNTALVGDNDTVFHGIGDVGRPDQYLATGTITKGSELRATPDGDWVIADGDDVRARYLREDIRISVVWKADCFVDEEAARIHDERLDDLTVDHVAEVFLADLRGRGMAAPAPEDPLSDQAWFRTLIKTYGFAKPRVSRDG